MRRSTQKIAPIFVVLLAAALAFPGLFGSFQKKVSAFAQDQSRADVPLRAKGTPPPRIIQGTPPANDNCANAIAVTSCPFSDSKDTGGATNETGEPSSTCTTQSNSVWYSYSNPTNASIVTVETCESSFDTAIMVYRQDGAACAFANFTPVACNDDACGTGLQSRLQFTADAGATYKIQIGGFAGATGALVTNIDCEELECDPIVIHGTLGSGSQDFTGVQSSGLQTGRLNRNGIASSCAAPKSCLIFDATGQRAYDAYQIHNDSGEDSCVTIQLSEASNQTCNLQSNAYLNTYNPASICTGYLGDPGLSTGVPPTATNFSVVVPANQTLIVVVHTTNPGESGCPYTLTILGDLCAGFDACVQDTRNPNRFILVSTTTGKYEFHDCSKGVVFSGQGAVSPAGPPPNCKFSLFDSGPDPKRSDRSVFVQINVCTLVASANVFYPATQTNAVLNDTNYTNNNCVCPGQNTR
jgi:hypothetical protein